MQKIQSFLEAVEQKMEGVKLSVSEKRKLKEEQAKKTNLFKTIMSLYRTINDKAEGLDSEQNKLFADDKLKEISILLPNGKMISVQGKLNNFTIQYQDHSISITQGDNKTVKGEELQFWLELFKDIGEEKLSAFDPTKQLQDRLDGKLTPAIDQPEAPLPVMSKKDLLKLFHNMATPDAGVSGEQIPLNKTKEDKAILLQDQDGTIQVLNQSIVENLIKENNEHNKLLQHFKVLQSHQHVLAKHFLKDADGIYSFNYGAAVKDSKDLNKENIEKAIEYLCGTLNQTIEPPSLADVLSNSLKMKLDPQNESTNIIIPSLGSMTHAQGFDFLLGGLISRFTDHEHEKPPLKITHPTTRKQLTTLTTADGKYIESNNLVAIYLQCCAKAGMSLEDFQEDGKLKKEDLSIYEDLYSDEFVAKYQQDFTELSTGDHLQRFIDGKLQLSEIETKFLKKLGIEPIIKAKDTAKKPAAPPPTKELPDKPVEAKKETTIKIPTEITKSSDGKEAFPNKLQHNCINKYYVPFKVAGKYISSEQYAKKMLEDIQSLLKQDPHLKIAITYAANNNESTGIYQSYQNSSYDDLEKGGWHISGGGQAPAFAILQKAILTNPALRERVHILPVTTVMHSVSKKADNPFPNLEKEASKSHSELVKRDVENIAEHIGAGYMVLGLTNQESDLKGRFAIGGDNAPGWRQPPNGPGLVVDEIMNDLKQGKVANRKLGDQITCDVETAFKKSRGAPPEDKPLLPSPVNPAAAPAKEQPKKPPPPPVKPVAPPKDEPLPPEVNPVAPAKEQPKKPPPPVKPAAPPEDKPLPPAERLANLDKDWPPKTSPPTVTSNSSIQSIDWKTAIVPTNFEFHEIPELKESNNNYRGSITNKTNPTDPLVNVTKNSLECPLDDNGKPKQDQPEAIAAALQIAVNEHKKTHNDPLIIEANSAFDLKNLSNIMKVLKQQKIPVYFNPTTENSEYIKKLIEKYNKEQFPEQKSSHIQQDHKTLQKPAGLTVKKK